MKSSPSDKWNQTSWRISRSEFTPTSLLSLSISFRTIISFIGRQSGAPDTANHFRSWRMQMRALAITVGVVVLTMAVLTRIKGARASVLDGVTFNN